MWFSFPLCSSPEMNRISRVGLPMVHQGRGRASADFAINLTCLAMLVSPFSEMLEERTKTNQTKPATTHMDFKGNKLGTVRRRDLETSAVEFSGLSPTARSSGEKARHRLNSAVVLTGHRLLYSCSSVPAQLQHQP